MREHEAIPLLRHVMRPFEQFLANDSMEDIIMNGPGRAFVQGGGRTTEHEIDVDFIEQQAIAILAGSLKRQNISSSQPLLSCDLTGGIRLQAVLPPCVEDGTVALAIRRPKEKLSSLDEIAEGGIFRNVQPITTKLSPEMEDLIRLYHTACAEQDPNQRTELWVRFLKMTMRARLTHVMCGEVGSGKTFFGMGLANEIPMDDRIVTIQDADEWKALPHRNRANLFYSKGGQGKANVGPTDLVEAALRMAMRWLLLQEVRGAEAYSFLRARLSGHPGLTTCHAASTRDAFPALAVMVKKAPEAAREETADIEKTLKRMIDVVIHFHRPEGKFAISEVWFGPAERVVA
jgi:type IV secretion system protein VirB11